MPERQALYRRYRSQTFGAVVGQEHVTRTLRNAIASGQVAHAYLLAGPRGIGKTSIARIVAKALNCPRAKDGEPCDECENCVAVREGRFLDLIEIDAASNRGIDEMRDLRDKVRFAPSQGEYKVYVIDEAHQLTTEAFNALLKTLEEPPSHVVFVLATTEAQRIPATIVSRTQRFDLRRIAHKRVAEQLASIAKQEKWKVEPSAIEAVARHAQGSLRDAESILDQLAAFAGGTVTIKDVDELLGASDWEDTALLFDALAKDDGAGAVTLIGKLVDDGRDLRLFVRRAIDHMRALVLSRATGGAPDGVSDAVAAKIKEQAPRFTIEKLARIAKRLLEAEQQLKTSDGTPLPLEIAILDLTTSVAPATPTPGGTRDASTAPQPAPQRPAPAAPARPTPATRAGVVDLSSRRAPVAAAPPRIDTARQADGPTTLVTLERVKSAWSELLEHTMERSVGKAAQLAKGEPVAMEGTVLVVGFADDFALTMYQDKGRVELEQSLSTMLGSAIRVRCIRQATPANAQPAIEDPMLRAALETFRRPERILEVE